MATGIWGLGTGYQGVGGNVSQTWQNPAQAGFGGGGGGAGGGGQFGSGGGGQFQQQLAGTLVDPFTAAFGNSVGTMNNLGGMLGQAFGGINASNQAADQANQDRQARQQMFQSLAGLLGQYQNAPRTAGIRFGDTQSRQNAG